MFAEQPKKRKTMQILGLKNPQLSNVIDVKMQKKIWACQFGPYLLHFKNNEPMKKKLYNQKHEIDLNPGP